MSKDATEIRPGGCVVYPENENWAAKDDAAVWHAAQAGVQQAKDELARRDRMHEGR